MRLNGFPDSIWPMNARMEENGLDAPVCIAHTKWFPCMTKDHRYDSDNKDCKVTRDHRCADLLRKFHSGHLTQPEVEWHLAESVANGSKVELIEYQGKGGME